MGALGVRSAYLVNGLIAGGTGVLYMTAYHLYLKKLEIKRLAARASTWLSHTLQNFNTLLSRCLCCLFRRG